MDEILFSYVNGGVGVVVERRFHPSRVRRSIFFALSTHTMQWFQERGFVEVGLDFLPEVCARHSTSTDGY